MQLQPCARLPFAFCPFAFIGRQLGEASCFTAAGCVIPTSSSVVTQSHAHGMQPRTATQSCAVCAAGLCVVAQICALQYGAVPHCQAKILPSGCYFPEWCPSESLK